MHKIPDLAENSRFCQKFKTAENSRFCRILQVWLKILDLDKNSRFRQKFKTLQKVQDFEEISRFFRKCNIF